MTKVINPYERKIIKIFKGSGFIKYKKLDTKRPNKKPDLLFLNPSDNYKFIAEVKEFNRFGRKLEKVSQAYRVDTFSPIADLIYDCNLKIQGLLKDNNFFAKLPYLMIVFTIFNKMDFGFNAKEIKNELGKYNKISAILIYDRYDIKENEWRNLDLKGLEQYIKQDKGKSRSREIHRWLVVKNPKPLNRFDFNQIKNPKIFY